MLFVIVNSGLRGLLVVFFVVCLVLLLVACIWFCDVLNCISLNLLGLV